MKLLVEIPRELDFVKLAHSIDGWEACIRTRPGTVDRFGVPLPVSIGWGFKQKTAGQALTIAANEARTNQAKLLQQRNSKRDPALPKLTDEEELLALLDL